MRWILKALSHRIISYLPCNESIHYFLRSAISKSLPAGATTFFETIDIGKDHFNNFIKYGSFTELSKVNFFEFGAGWDLIVPILFYMLGIENQTIIDIRSNARLKLINDSLNKFFMHEPSLNKLKLQIKKKPYQHTVSNLTQLQEQLGIIYRAPCDARQTGLPSDSFDFISSTATLEHIPAGDIAAILKECHRLLRPRGIISFLIDLKDHYSYFDSSISPYNFLKFSDTFWSLYNPPIYFQNRLRYPDYIAIVHSSGFEIIEQRPEHPTLRDKELLTNIPIANKFTRGYSFEDLGIKTLFIVCRKKGHSPGVPSKVK